MKLVFDTNVYIAEALGGEAATKVVDAARRARWRVFISEHVLDEIFAVLFEDLGVSRRSAVLAVIRAARNARMIALAASRHAVPADAKDSPILQTAVQCGADYLVTNDRHLLELNPYEGVNIVSMADLLPVPAGPGSAQIALPLGARAFERRPYSNTKQNPPMILILTRRVLSSP